MKIALVGYGKMGKTIEQVAIKRGHEISMRISSGNRNDLDILWPNIADVAIEFSTPDAALDNVSKCLQNGLNVVCGTTGWDNQSPIVGKLITEKGTGFLFASNFSIGVNILFEVNKQLARFMSNQKQYHPSITETHHVHKKDSPSGTAITLAQQIIANISRLESWQLGKTNNEKILPIISYRTDEVPGTHHITYSSDIDDIELIHTAHSRDGFAIGAVLAAEFLYQKKGTYSMHDALFGGMNL
jgi:4-hydroxy-tetrahydrodipicolinate reductase